MTCVRLLALLAGALILTPSWGAQSPTDGPSDGVAIRVAPIRDAGGLDVPAPGTALNARLGAALTMLLEGEGWNVIAADESSPAGTVVFTLECDLSRVSVVAPDISAGLLCAARLFVERPSEDEEESGARALIGQWALRAENVRYLDGSVGLHAGVGPWGLAGVLVGRVMRTIAATAPGQLGSVRSLVSRTDERLALRVRPGPGGYRPGRSLVGSLSCDAAGDVFLLDVSPSGVVRLLAGNGQGPAHVDAAQQLPLRDAGAGAVPADAEAGAHTLVACVRVASSGESGGQGRSGTRGEATSPVELLDAGTAIPADLAGDAAVAALLGPLRDDPADSWLFAAAEYTVLVPGSGPDSPARCGGAVP